MQQQELELILEKYIAGKASPQEEIQLLQWYRSVNHSNIEIPVDSTTEMNTTRLRMLLQIQQQTGMVQKPVKKMNWKRYAAAAAILFIVATGSILLLRNDKPTTMAVAVPAHDIAAPNSSKAMITLADGRTVVLDSVLNGTVAMQNDVTVVKNADGEIVYQPTSNSNEPMAIAYNTLYNPRSSKVINLTLSDGSKVWLNAESSLRYPVAFAGSERKVEITGEAYFEVAKTGKQQKTFIVKKDDVEVTVLGTHFNVNTYEDEKELKVTLLEGSVRVSQKAETKILKPGQQAVLNNGSIAINNNTDIDAVMAWKNGFFTYKACDLATIMRQVSKWYDVNVVFKQPVNEKFYVDLQRNTPVSNLFKILEATKAVHFTIEGKTIYVTP